MANNATGSAKGQKLGIEGQEGFELSTTDRKAFVDALINPQPVNDRLRDTVRLYREAAGV
ncbi:type II toxin -antitoxin system TacA 1-like antitoxin [Mesorhizobium sp. ArgA1]